MMSTVDSSVSSSESFEYHCTVFYIPEYRYRVNNLRAMVIDTLQVWFQQFHDRLNNTHRHETWMDGYVHPLYQQLIWDNVHRSYL